MPTFLHRPIKTLDEVRALFGAPESDLHDAKAMPNPDEQRFREDVAADVAAFANGQGGDLLLGVTERRGVLNGFNPNLEQLGALQERVSRALLDYLRPEPIAREVQLRPLTDGTDRCLVVSVPASAAPVAVVSNHRRFLSFPVRAGTTTDYFGWEELMLRADISSRAKKIALLNLVTGNNDHEASLPWPHT